MIAAEYAGITFTAKELDRNVTGDEQCRKCLFAESTHKECVALCKVAVDATLPDCDVPGPRGNPVIYVKTTKGDPRQLDCAGPVV